MRVCPVPREGEPVNHALLVQLMNGTETWRDQVGSLHNIASLLRKLASLLRKQGEFGQAPPANAGGLLQREVRLRA
jgi:hypothetical protein